MDVSINKINAVNQQINFWNSPGQRPTACQTPSVSPSSPIVLEFFNLIYEVESTWFIKLRYFDLSKYFRGPQGPQNYFPSPRVNDRHASFGPPCGHPGRFWSVLLVFLFGVDAFTVILTWFCLCFYILNWFSQVLGMQNHWFFMEGSSFLRLLEFLFRMLFWTRFTRLLNHFGGLLGPSWRPLGGLVGSHGAVLGVP